MKAGDAVASVAALTYAAEGGQPIARWKLGEMYADGDGVPRDDVKAYHYFNQMVEDYDEDEPDRRNLGAISNAFVAVGVYCLNGIPDSDVRADPRRAHELFQYAATIFGDPNAQYNLAHMYLVGAGGVAKDSVAAVRWLAVAAEKGHPPSEALLGHMLFTGEGVPHQRARGLMWLEFAKDARAGSQGGVDTRPLSARLSVGERGRPASCRGHARCARQGNAAVASVRKRHQDLPQAARPDADWSGSAAGAVNGCLARLRAGAAETEPQPA